MTATMETQTKLSRHRAWVDTKDSKGQGGAAGSGDQGKDVILEDHGGARATEDEGEARRKEEPDRAREMEGRGKCREVES